MTEHPDIDELFAADDDEPTGDGAVPEDDDRATDERDVFDELAELDDDQPDDTGALDDEPVVDEETPDDGEDLLALAEEASARYEPVVLPGLDEPESAVAPSPEPSPKPASAGPSDEHGAPGPTNDESGLVLQFPSRDFPPPPVFRMRVPHGWVAVPVPDALMAVRRPDEIETFHPNVLVRSRRVAATAEPGAALAELAAVETVPEGMELVGEGLAAKGATPARWVEIRFTGPDGIVLRARHLLVYVPASEHVANVLSVVGTWPDAATDEVGHEVTDVVGSLRLFRPTT